jgi:iron only hydrogenase large subunit-like protein
MSNLVSFIGAKNSFAENVTEPSVCDKTALLVMDCASCECCDVCCDEEHSNVCNYHDDVHTLLGFDCGSWYKSCLPVADYFANSSSALTEKEYY